MIRPILTLAALGALTTGAMAQESGNELRIVQEGPDNTLRVDQSAATNSFVGGTTAGVPSGTNQLEIIFSVPIEEDENNPGFDVEGQQIASGQLRREQVSVPVPNVFTNSIATLRDAPGVGIQRNLSGGAGNTLNVTVDDDGGAVLFSQINQEVSGSSSIVGLRPANTGQVLLSGSGVAGLFQEGFGNDAIINLDGGLSAGVVQSGSGNTADLTVQGSGATGLIVQTGNGNDTGPVTLTANGSQVVYEQIGTDLQPIGPSLEVVTTAPQVTIIQSSGF